MLKKTFKEFKSSFCLLIKKITRPYNIYHLIKYQNESIYQFFFLRIILFFMKKKKKWKQFMNWKEIQKIIAHTVIMGQFRTVEI